MDITLEYYYIKLRGDILNSQNKNIGYLGEHYAKQYLINNNYNMIHSNYRNRFGEIDLICLKGEILAFIEVKSRYSLKYGLPLEAVTYYKANKIKNTARLFILQNNINSFYIRFDIIEVYFNYIDSSFKINHLEDAFR